jgi:periplasmic glucans biosynthesis protein
MKAFDHHIDRRSLLAATAFILPVLALGRPGRAQSWADLPFDFESLTDVMRRRSETPYQAPQPLEGPLGDLTYQLYRLISFDPERARLADGGSDFRLHAFHPGWLFSEPVTLYQVVDGRASPMTFGPDDFRYFNEAAEFAEKIESLPGISGFRLHYPLNTAGVFDELISFQGASYFRALGRGSAYGLSARGLAINTATQEREEFPRFTEFYVVPPAAGDTSVTVYAALDSESVTGAFRFVITPGGDTTVDTTARLFFRSDVAQLGVAPLTSMFLYAETNRAKFDDYRPQVHDSDGLLIRRANGDRLWRSLGNPPELATSYFAETSPVGFGLHQRDRDFESYQDAGAHYQLRPSVDVDFVGDWGAGAVRLVEIPSDLEINDNIVAYWVPDGDVKKGDSREYHYRLRWGMLPPDPTADLAFVASTRTGLGGPSGVPYEGNARKFVIDFRGGTLPKGDMGSEIVPHLTAAHGEVDERTMTVFYVPEANVWRLIGDVSPDGAGATELVAYLENGNEKLTETWLYQWRTE